MPFAIPTLLLKPATGWLVALVILLALGGGTLWYRHEARLSAQEATLNKEDAKRWVSASAYRDRIIAGLNEQIETQNAAIKKAGEAAAKMDQIVRQTDLLNRELSNKLSVATAALEKQAHEHPEDDRPLGPIGLAYGRLLSRGPE